MDKKIALAIGILKTGLVVESLYKNDVIRDAIKVLDPEEYANMEKDTDQILNEILTRK